MKKMDEMERHIQLRSEELGFRAGVLALSLLTIFNAADAFRTGTNLSILPTLILCLMVSVHGISMIALKQKMTSGEDDYKEENNAAVTVITVIAVIALIMTISFLLLPKG